MITLATAMLPVMGVLGWLLAKTAKPKSTRTPKVASASNDYLKGINFLINEEPDKAVDIFVHLMQVDTDTSDIHFILGALFRSRGEISRATKIHQNLLARSNLSLDDRQRALFELAQDYFTAGVLDRAEGLFKQCLETKKYYRLSVQHLFIIYQSEKEWQKCIDLMHAQYKIAEIYNGATLAHYYCELFRLNKKNNLHHDEMAFLNKIYQYAPKMPRLMLLEADFYYENKNIN